MSRIPELDTRAATIIIAAANSLNKNKADRVIESGSDNAEFEINDAINRLTANGGEIVLLDGIYTVSNPIQLDDNVKISGLGDATTIRLPAGLDTDINVIENSEPGVGNNNIIVRDLRIDLNRTSQTAGTMHGIYMENVEKLCILSNQITEARDRGIYINGGDRIMVNRNNVHDNGEEGIFITATDGCSINNNCVHENDNHGIQIDNLAEASYIVENTCYLNGVSGVAIITSPRAMLSNNTCRNNTDKGIVLFQADDGMISNNYCGENGTYGINIIQSDENNIVGNVIDVNGDAGVYIDSSVQNNISSNQIINNDREGIHIYGSNRNNITNNKLRNNSQETDNTYDNILITADSNVNMVQANFIRRGAGAPQTRYGINIDNANCDNNWVTNNDLRSSGITGNLNDAGTGTITAAGNQP